MGRILRPRPAAERRLPTNDKRVEMTKNQAKIKLLGLSPNASILFEREDHLADEIVYSCQEGVVCEVGCGYGHVSRLFDDDKYIGVDITPARIEEAKRKNPNKTFKLIDWDDPYPIADCYLFLTVMLHIPDEEIQAIINKIPGRVVVCECMSHWIRHYGAGFDFQRDPNEYEALFAKAGKSMADFSISPIKVFPYFISTMVFI